MEALRGLGAVVFGVVVLAEPPFKVIGLTAIVPASRLGTKDIDPTTPHRALPESRKASPGYDEA